MAGPGDVRCLHCRRNKPQRHKRGLCFRCYHHEPGVRSQYPTSGSKYARRGIGHGGGLNPPDEPTAAVPGSEAKVAVLEQRAAAGLRLWHPEDARL